MAFDGNGANRIEKLIRDHFDYNNALKESIKTIISYVEKIKSLDDVEKKEVLGFFSIYVTFKNDLEQMRTIYDKLEQDLPDVMEKLKQMVIIIENENKEIFDFLNKPKANIIERDNLIENLKTKYNAQKVRLWQELGLKLGQNVNYTTTMLDRMEENESAMAKKFLGLYLELEELIKHPDGKNGMRWDGIYQNLKSMTDMMRILSGSYKENFIAVVWNIQEEKKTKNAKPFAENFFNSPKTFDNYFRIYGEEYKEYEIYSKLPEEQKKSIDKLLSESLSLLFKGIKSIEDKLKEDKDKNDAEFETLKSEYEIAYSSFVKKLISDTSFKSKTSPEECKIYGVDGLKGVKFKDFRSTNLKPGKINKEIIAKVISYLEVISSEDDAYESFKKNNGIYFNSSNSSSSSSSGGDKWYKNAADYEDIHQVISYVESESGNLINSSDTNWKQNLAVAKPKVLESIQVTAKYLNKKRSKINDSDRFISELKNIYEIFSKDISNINSLKRHCTILVSLMDEIKSNLPK